jgi:FKBP-type peptidyl-prolyl cis-trans isomerase
MRECRFDSVRGMMSQLSLKRARCGTPDDSGVRRVLNLKAAVVLCTIAVGLQAQQHPLDNAALVKAQPAPEAKAPDDVAAAPAGTPSTASGLRMRVLQPGQGGEVPGANDCVLVRFTAWRRDGSLQSTSGLHGETTIQSLPRTVAGVAEALKLMVQGEKRRVWVPANLTYLPTRHGPLGKIDDDEPPPGVDLTFDLELVRIMKVPATPADLKSPAKDATILPSGLGFQVLTDGRGKEHPSASSRVSMHYSAWTAAGRLFETTVTSGQPGTFQIGSLLPGWREGVLRMVVGEKARLWLPAALAYGEKPAGRKLPAGGLVFDVELLAIE